MNTSPAVSASSPFDNPSRFGGRAPDTAGASSVPESPFDSQPMLALHDKLTSWYDAEWNRQASNRFQQALDEDFYDGMQWTQEDAQALIERGQAPLVFNEVKPTIDWIIGTERRTRVDYKILPREKDDEALAEIKTKLMKYVSDANKLPWHRSMAFADAIKAGMNAQSTVHSARGFQCRPHLLTDPNSNGDIKLSYISNTVGLWKINTSSRHLLLWLSPTACRFFAHW